MRFLPPVAVLRKEQVQANDRVSCRFGQRDKASIEANVCTRATHNCFSRAGNMWCRLRMSDSDIVKCGSLSTTRLLSVTNTACEPPTTVEPPKKLRPNVTICDCGKQSKRFIYEKIPLATVHCWRYNIYTGKRPLGVVGYHAVLTPLRSAVRSRQRTFLLNRFSVPTYFTKYDLNILGYFTIFTYNWIIV